MLRQTRDRGELRDQIDIDHAVNIIEGPIIYRYMVRGDTFHPHDLDAILDLVVAAVTK